MIFLESFGKRISREMRAVAGASMTVAAVAVFAVTVAAVPLRADVISVNFVGGQSGSTAPDLTKGGATVTGTAGAVPASNWNNEGSSQQTTPVTVVNNAGAAAASLSYTAPDNWAASPTSPAGGTNAALMSGYLDNLQNSGSITVTGLGANYTSSGYQVLVYQNADSSGSFGYTATDNAGHSITAYGLQTGGANGNYPLAGGTDGFVGSTSANPAGPGSPANYVILNGLTGSNFTITAVAGTTGDGRVRPNGFQIVSVFTDNSQSGPTFTVNTTSEHDDGVCGVKDCTLLEAINAANAASGASVVTFSPGLTGTITNKLVPTGLAIVNQVEIRGPGARSLSISGTDLSRVFNVTANPVTISGLAIVHGRITNLGGGILNSGNLTLQNCEIDQNVALSTSNANYSGGAIQNQSGATLTLTGCSFSGNQAGSVGGAIQNLGTLTATNCTFTSNSSAAGGAINTSGTASFLNCTIASNVANGVATDEGGGIRNTSGSTCSITNTIVIGNTASHGGGTQDVDGTFSSGGRNLIGRTTGSSGWITNPGNPNRDLTGTDASPLTAAFDPYGNYGGQTDTLALVASNPAVNAAGNSAPPVDQRGYSRVGAPDIGAFELGAAPPPTPTPSPTPTATPTATPATPQALNISTRLLVQGGNNVLIAGFIVTGSDQKTVAIRGIGPSLSQFFSGTLADPTLELHTGNTTLATNDNWQDDSSQAAQLSANNLAPSDPKESGIVATLPPQTAYTAILADKNGHTGIGVAEIFDISQSANAQLANISSRGFVLTDNNVMIGGFILGGNGATTRVAVRGLGPSLAQFGLNPVLADPTLELHDGNGGLIASNDNWQDDPAQAAQLMANNLAPADPNESAIFISLAPGQWTAILAGQNGGTGIGTVEVYNLH